MCFAKHNKNKRFWLFKDLVLIDFENNQFRLHFHFLFDSQLRWNAELGQTQSKHFFLLTSLFSKKKELKKEEELLRN